jgi:RNA polymerase sigma-70 factor, ECF subfamily
VRERDWINRILSGDKEAGERFVQEYYPGIFRLLRYFTDSVQVAEDLTQQTFVQAWKALPAFRRESQLRTWLHRIAYHEYTRWLRDRREHAPLEAALYQPVPQADSIWENLVLPQALAQLSEEQRAVFLLYHIQELSVAETASVLNLPAGTVKSRLFAARQRLRELLEVDEATASALPAVSPSVQSQEGERHL